jgi:hypothetical protein
VDLWHSSSKKILEAGRSRVPRRPLRLYALQNIPQIPRPSPEAVETIIDQMAETNPQVAKLRPEQLIDARFF